MEVSDAEDKAALCLRLKRGEPFAFAGLWDAWKQPEGGWLVSYAIIATDPNELTATVYNRVPVILKPADYDRWLSREENARPHHRQQASQAGSRSSSSAAVTGNPPRFKGTSVWLAGRNTAFAAAEIDGSEGFVRNSEVFVITRSCKMRAQ